ncbi:hypothetical protein C0Q89_15010 [Lacticaseibacillus rhamnosus]|nr:hypothetical protein C0Q89_15010 [Lacticaseibacillus rhamnosus]
MVQRINGFKAASCLLGAGFLGLRRQFNLWMEKKIRGILKRVWLKKTCQREKVKKKREKKG